MSDLRRAIVIEMCVIVAAAQMVWVSAAWAQAAGEQCAAESQELEKLRAEQQLSDLDNDQFDAWIDCHVAEISAAADDPAQDSHAIAADFVGQVGKRDGSTPAFENRLAVRVAGAARKSFSAGDETPVVTARALADALDELDSAEILDAALEGLSFNDQTVRYMCGKAINRIKSAIDADVNLTDKVLRAIGKIAGTERSDVVAAMLYRAMEYPGRAADSQVAIAKVLEDRLDNVLNTGNPLGRAELQALRYLAASSGGLSNSDQKTKLVSSLAKLLRAHVDRYVARREALERTPGTVAVGGALENTAVEETIYLCEDLLTKLYGGSDAPNVRAKMAQAGPAVGPEMLLELNFWIGTEGEPGRLNNPPWNLPVGVP